MPTRLTYAVATAAEPFEVCGAPKVVTRRRSVARARCKACTRVCVARLMVKTGIDQVINP